MSASVSFYVDGNTSLHLSRYGVQRAPILSLDGPGYSLTLASHSTVPLSEQLAFARELAANAADFLTALELFAAANDDSESE
ncbi:hypothetical protein [Kitasatospora azatica]|uniref:hypothetical protein n=1 Tax=Kitasatospora azatica TaxID=58347 RepID=UPI0005670824|nr:hypothetical protein [Kitasatospora azatica]